MLWIDDRLAIEAWRNFLPAPMPDKANIFIKVYPANDDCGGPEYEEIRLISLSETSPCELLFSCDKKKWPCYSDRLQESYKN